MAEYAEGSQIHQLSDMIRAERMVAEVTERELQAWVAKFLQKLRENAIPGIAPDTTFLEYMKEEWDHDHAPVILSTIATLWAKRYKKKRRSMADNRDESFLSETRNTLSLVPDRTFQVATEVIQDGIQRGLDQNQLLDELTARILDSIGTTAERTGRLVGPLLVNTATLASYEDAQNLDGEGPFVKSWVSVHDLAVRPTHVIADADPINRRIPLAQKFLVGGFLADIPRDLDLPLWESAGCRCICDVRES